MYSGGSSTGPRARRERWRQSGSERICDSSRTSARYGTDAGPADSAAADGAARAPSGSSDATSWHATAAVRAGLLGAPSLSTEAAAAAANVVAESGLSVDDLHPSTASVVDATVRARAWRPSARLVTRMSDVKHPENAAAEPILVAVLTLREWQIVIAHLQIGVYQTVAEVIGLLTNQLQPQANAAHEAAALIEAKRIAGADVRPAVDPENAANFKVN